MRHNFFFFWETRSPFSQWHPVGFMLEGIHFKTAEHYMMYGKAMLFGDAESALKIINAKTPNDAKSLGRGVKNFDKAVWERECKEIVYKGNLAKFSQNPKLKEALFATGDKEMVEAAPNDPIWGIGLRESDSRAWNKSTWKGTNYLGQVLTRVRQTLKEAEEE